VTETEQGPSRRGPGAIAPGAPSAEALAIRFDALLSGARFYTGVGSRQTPQATLGVMTQVAQRMALRGLVLRSGGASGADSAFEAGAGVACEIWLPIKGFQKNLSPLWTIDQRCFEIAAGVHPAWGRCSYFAQRAHARNVHQVLGADLATPSIVLLCWTPDGATNEMNATGAGGTRTAIVLAARNGVPVLNLARPRHHAIVEAWLARDLAPDASDGAIRNARPA
jgi:hypothetical protein